MKSLTRTSLTLLTLGLASFSAQALTLCYDYGGQYPWVLKNGKGLNIVLLEMVAANMGDKLELRPMPWKDCMEELKKGVVDGAFAASYTAERAGFAAYPMVDGKPEGKPDVSKRLHIDGYTLLRLKGSKVSWNGSKFSNLSGPIGTQAAYSIIADLKKWGATVDSNADTPETLLRRFGSGQIQAIALLTGEAKHTMKSPYLAGKVELISPPLIEKPYFLIFSHRYYDKNRNTADEVWAKIAKLRESAEYKAKEANPASAGEFADLRLKMAAARESLVVMMVNNDKRDPAQQKLVKDSADQVSAQLARMKAPAGKESQFKELVTTWDAFKKTRETELVPAILKGNDAEARKIGGGIQKERIAKCLALASELDK